MLPIESQVNRLGFFGLWTHSIPSCEIQQVHSSHFTQLSEMVYADKLSDTVIV